MNRKYDLHLLLFAVGLILGAAGVYLIGAHQMHVLAGAAQASQQQESTRTAELRANYHLAVEHYAACEKIINEIGSESTLIVEPATGVPLGNSVAGRVIGALTEQPRVRWLIPYKVTPFIYGDPAGTKFYWQDHGGILHEGGVPIRMGQ